MRKLNAVKLKVPDKAWNACGGDDGDQDTHLVAMVEFGGASFHLEAEQIKPSKDGLGPAETVEECRQESLDEFLACSFVECSNDPQTATIMGKEYFVWMSPFEM